MNVDEWRTMFCSGVIFVLAWVASTTARYADYSGARMPFYHEDYPNRDSISRDDYPERSPDASVPLDYKYEDASRDKYESPTENPAEENDVWQSSNNKNDRPIDIEDDYSNDLDKLPDEREFKSNQRVAKRNKFNREDGNLSHEGSQRFVNSKRRSQENKLRHWNKSIQNNRMTKSRSKTETKNSFGYGRGLRRSGRRKAREREDQVTEAIFEADRDFDSEENNENESSLQVLKRRRMGGGMSEVDMNFIPHRDLGALADKSYPNYEEYYDMKRALNIKNNLLSNPRTKASVTPTLIPDRPVDTWFRRANIPDLSAEKVEAKTSESTSSTSQRTTTVSTTISTTFITSLKITIVSQNTSELSVAEKSRLSILKKAQRKENLGGGTAITKPPVLMQVTDRMQTVVMVEPPGSQLQRMQAREISDNSLDRIARAKRLMRHKLLSNAKNIHELTDNWDELVCDYIDVSLLNGTVGFQLRYGIVLVVNISVVLLNIVFLWS